MKRTPHIDIVKLTTKEYLQDLKVKYRQLLNLFELIDGYECARTLDLIDFRNSTHLNINVLEDNMANYYRLKQDYNDAKNVLEKEKDCVLSIQFGDIVWDKYVCDASWGVLRRDYSLCRRTLQGRINRALESLYFLIPEEYRRYTFPDAILTNEKVLKDYL